MTLTIKTPLDQLSEAMMRIEEARGEPFLSHAERNSLEAAAVNLRNLEQCIIETKEKELMSALAADSLELKQLVVEINASSKHLAKVSEAVEKASKAVEALINILLIAARAGLL